MQTAGVGVELDEGVARGNGGPCGDSGGGGGWCGAEVGQGIPKVHGRGCSCGGGGGKRRGVWLGWIWIWGIEVV